MHTETKDNAGDEVQTQEEEKAKRSVAFLWERLSSDIQRQLISTGVLDDAAKAKEPLCVLVAPGETALMAVGSAAIYEALRGAYERVVVCHDIPQRGWHVRVYFDVVKVSL